LSSRITELPAQPGGRPERPLSERAYELLREDILSGRIAPGTKLKMELLQERYGISNTPLREALSRLAAEGLTIADERRGFRAPTATLQQFEDLNAFRLVVEEGALSSAIAHGDVNWEANVAAAYHALAAVENSGARPSNSEEWRRRHKAFHMALFAGCTSQRLIDACDHAFDEGERFRRLAALKRHEPRHQDGEHELILRATLARDARLATALLRSHLLQTAEHVRLYMQGQRTPGDDE